MTTQKRLEKRVDVDFDVDVYEIIINGKPIKLTNSLKMKVINLSANGALLFSELEFDVGAHFGTVLRFDNENLFVACLSVRKEKSNTGFYYGCTLLGVSQTDQRIIRQFVFKQEIQQRIRLNKEQKRTGVL